MKYYKYTCYGSMGTYEKAITIEENCSVTFVMNEYGKVVSKELIEFMNSVHTTEKEVLTEDEFLMEMFKYLSYHMTSKTEAIKYFNELCYQNR